MTTILLPVNVSEIGKIAPEGMKTYTDENGCLVHAYGESQTVILGAYNSSWYFNTDTGAAHFASVSYTPSNPGYWAGEAPKTLNDAQDRVTAALRGLLGNNIP